MLGGWKRPELRPIEWTGLVLVAALVFVWPIRGTIALRNVLLITALAGWLVIWFRSAHAKPSIAALKGPLLWYAALTAWLVVGAFLISIDTLLSLQELKSQWLRSGLAGLLGFLVAGWAVRPRYDGDKARLCVLLIVAPLSMHLLLTLAHTFWIWAAQGAMPGRASSLISGKLGMSFNVNALLAVIAADVVARARRIEPLVPLRSAGIAALIAAGLACTYFLHARNGTVCLAALFAFAAAMRLREGSNVRKARFLTAMIVIFLAAASAVVLKADPRWLTVQESAELGWDTETHRAWLDNKAFPLPQLENGKPAQHSAYMRAAWMKESLKVMADHPLGMGYMRGAMGRAFQEKYGQGLGGHSDNGLIDFSLAAGLPGVLLGAGLLASLLLLGWRAYDRAGATVGLALLLVVLGYALRTLLDSTTRDNYLEQFLFMCGLLATLSSGSLAARGEAAAT